MIQKINRSFIVGVVAALLVSFAPSAHAQIDPFGAAINRIVKGNPVLIGVGADDTDEALLIKYVGTNANGGTVTVAANGNITLAQGAVGSSTADASVTCGAGGNGVIVVANAACDTFGEVVDVINATSNWRAVIIDGLRSDSSNDTLNALSETAANSQDGLLLKWDTDVAKTSSRLVAPPEARKFGFYFVNRKDFVANPFAQLKTILFLAKMVSTYASGTSVWSLNCAVPVYKAAGQESNVTSYSANSAATTVEKVFDFSGFGLMCPQGARMVSRLTNSAAMASTAHFVAGLQF